MTSRKLDLSGVALALLVNSASGNKDTDAHVAQIRERIAPKVRSFTVHHAGQGRDIAAIARDAVAGGADVVAVLGGDGTQSAVAGALAGNKAVMAVLPGGTFNYFARELGVGETLDEALETLETGQISAIDLGEVNGLIFLNNASFGVYPAILEQREAIYRRWGRSRFMAYWSVLVTLADLGHPMQLRVTTGTEVHDFITPLAFAARSPYQLESLGLDGADAVRAGQFALFIAQNHSRFDMAMAALRLALGQAAKGKDFELVVADDIVISGGRSRRLLAFDGEKTRMQGPWHLSIRRGALDVITPAQDGQQVGA